MLILYDKDQCPFCWRVRMSLTRLGLPVEFRAHDDAEWKDVWPDLTHQGTVPVLVADELVLTDSRVILEYLDERFGGLWPKTADARAHAREVFAYADTQLGPPARDLIFECRANEPEQRDQELIANAVIGWKAALPGLSDILQTSDWFADDCSIADYAAATRFGLAFAYGMPMEALPENLRAWLVRIFSREEVVLTAPAQVRQWLSYGSLL